jgi:hypothetical protein
VPTTDQDHTHESLGQEECLRLLGSAAIGRLAYTQAALPAIRPVSFLLRDQDVVIPVRADSPLLDAVRDAVVAFETDSYDHVARTGWSVTVVGPSRVLSPAPARDHAPPGAGDDTRSALCLIAVHLGLVHGWRTSLPVWTWGAPSAGDPTATP